MFKTLVILVCFLSMMPVTAADLTIADAWIRLLPADLPLGGYFELHNGGAQAINLVGVSSPAFREIQIHKSSERNGMESMRRVSDIQVLPGASVSFAPGAYHLMLLGRKRPLHVGDKVRVTLKFSGAQPEETVVFAVRGVAGE